ncbi:MAG: hypothetical protein HYY43_01720 [Deltaproteobacteria bacterium]|nr:hypothetical protein [Deltaproteobacteria bacterium]
MRTFYFMDRNANKAAKLIVIAWVFAFLHGCAGPDYMPQYFPSAETKDGKTPKVDESDNKDKIPSGSCTVSLSSTLCVILHGDNVSVGTDEKEPLCTEVGPIPIEVNGANLILRGNTFPDIPFEGHGLPAPITINAKGTGDGSKNLGKGKVDADGNITIEGFSFYINALGMVGEIPDLLLTTGKIEDLDGIDPASGEPLGANSHVKIITGTILGHLFPAADEKLFGASLFASFDGTINPPFSECKGTEAKPLATYVVKLVVDDKGEQTEAVLPGANRMEVGEAYTAQGPENVGPQFEAAAKFKIVNATTSPLEIDIPPIAGPFIIEAAEGSLLKQALPPKTPLIIKVTFRPTSENVKKSGDVNEMLVIGPDVYQLIGSATSPSGKPALTIADESGGGVAAEDILNVGNVMVSTTGRREFFMCKKVSCNGLEQPTQCVQCVDVLNNVCQLLPVDKNGKPVGEVDSACKNINPSAKDDLAIGLFGDNTLSQKQVLEIKNDGIKPLTISSIEIQDLDGAKSKNQFKVSVDSELPITLAPYSTSKTAIKITIIYEPSDILGLDGTEANVGHPVKDKAILHIVTDGGSQSIELSGATTVKEIPDMQVFFKSATGTKELKDGSQFSFRGLTTSTSDLAVPIFIKLSDSATSPLRITGVEIESGSPFEWLDAKEKIEAKPKDNRCVIPVFDEKGGQVSAISDLNPVSLLPDGFDLKPGAFNADTMPLLGCVNFHMDGDKKRQYIGLLAIQATEITSEGEPVRNSDGSIKQSNIKINLLAVINPLKGRLVFRVTQTMAAIMK